VDLRNLPHPPPVTDPTCPRRRGRGAWYATAPEVFALDRARQKSLFFAGLRGRYPYVSADEVDATWRLPIRKIVVAEWLKDLSRDRFADDTAICVPTASTQTLLRAQRGKQARPTVGFIYAHAPLKGTTLLLAR